MKMLKFKGKPWELRAYLLFVCSEYGEKTTIKEICERI